MIVAQNSFAAEYPRTPENWIRFPPDKPLREALFLPESMKHPARANLYMLQEIYRYVGKPGETLLDITSGVGSLMMACLEGYQVVMVELSELWHELQLRNAVHLGVHPVMLQGDCREYLPLPCDHIIFSPPYSSTFHAKSTEGTGAMQRWMVDRGYEAHAGLDEYVKDDPRNLGKLNPFMFMQEMIGIYRLCLQSVRVGGTMTVIIQDFIRGGKKQELAQPTVTQCERMGWTLDSWHVRQQPGSPHKALAKKKGFKVTETEEILIFRRGE